MNFKGRSSLGDELIMKQMGRITLILSDGQRKQHEKRQSIMKIWVNPEWQKCKVERNKTPSRARD